MDKKNQGGMWSGKRGLSQGCDHNQQARDEVLAELKGRLDDLMVMLRDVEKAIDRAGVVLSISQPTNISGKYGLRWWRMKPGMPYREPVIVRWVIQRNGRMTPKRARILKAKTHGTLAINASQTQECLYLLADLIKRRAQIKNRIASLGKSLRGLEGVSYRINNEAERIESLHSQAVNNLLANGYEVEARLIEDMET